MVGLVDKLRNYAKKHAMHDAEKVLVTEAADEIERLQRSLNSRDDFLGRMTLWDAYHAASGQLGRTPDK